MNSETTSGISIIIPAYNEEDSIEQVIDQIEGVMRQKGGESYPFEIIIVDDGSTDQTGIHARTKNITLVTHPSNQGYGAALKSGIAASRYETIVITDADGTYPNEEIPNLVAELRDCSMVVGARIGKDVHIPLIRKPAKWFLNQLANYLSGYKIPDLNSGLRVFQKQHAQKYLNILPDGFSFTTTITLAMHCDRYQVKYRPINYAKRVGQSKIHPIKDTANFVQLIIRTVIYFRPLKVFLPLSISLMLLAALIALLQAILYRDISTTASMLFLTGLQIGSIGALADLVVRRTA
jgi:glycosyltransferase involved in cell wall biosynthesis